jgi:myo-inositol-1(or 4)-monophosphatase
VAPRRDFSDALVGCGVPHLGKAKSHPRFKAELAAVMARALNVRRLGAASLDLAFVAAGRLDAFWERGLNPWDVAAGIVLVREAGGFVSDLDGRDAMLSKGEACAGNEAMHKTLLALVKG